MKKLLVVAFGMIASVCLGWGLDSITKAVDKAAETVDKATKTVDGVNNVLKAPVQQPPANTASPQVRPPQATAADGNPPPTGAPAVPPGYGQPSSYANASRTKPPQETAAGGNPPPTGTPSVSSGGGSTEAGLSDNEALAVYNEFKKKIDSAARDGYKISGHHEWNNSVINFIGKKPSQIKAWEKERDDAIAEAKAKLEAELAAANEATKKKQDELKTLLAKYDRIAVQFRSDVAMCKKAVSDVVDKYSEFLDNSDKNFTCSAMYNSDVENYLKNKEDGKYDKLVATAGNQGKSKGGSDWELDNAIKEVKGYVESVSSGDADTERRGRAQTDVSATNGDLAAVVSSALREQTKEYICQKERNVADKIRFKINQELDRALQWKEISVEFRDLTWEERDQAGNSIEKLQIVFKKIGEEIKNRKKLAADRGALIKKLAAADVSTWLSEIEKYQKGETRDAVLGDALLAKFGSYAEYGKDSEALADLVAKLYSADQQQELLDSNKTAISVVIAVVSSIRDAEIRKKLLLDSTDWAFHTYRKSSEEENQYAYLVLLSREKDVDVLMAVYEKQDRINFTYEKAAKSGGAKTAGDALEQMWKNEQNNNGAGYGRLGLWMLDNCGKEFCQRVEKLTEARRKVAKGQMFIMNDFYLGMPHRDFKLIAKNWDKKKGRVTASFGTFNNKTLSEINFGAKARFEYLGIKKDGLTGLGQFVAKYIPGGMDSVGELKVGAEAVEGYDPENPEIKVNTWWYTDCPKYDCRIRMYDSGTICIINTSDDDAPTLDFSTVK